MYITTTQPYLLLYNSFKNCHWSCCCTLTLRILHFEVYDIFKCKKFFIGFFNELGNYKQNFFLHQQNPQEHRFPTFRYFQVLDCLIFPFFKSHAICFVFSFICTEHFSRLGVIVQHATSLATV